MRINPGEVQLDECDYQLIHHNMNTGDLLRHRNLSPHDRRSTEYEEEWQVQVERRQKERAKFLNEKEGRL